MKKLSITLVFLISLNVFSQQKKAFSSELDEFVLQCETIARTLIDKNKATNLTEWYEGHYKGIAETNIKQLESDIDNSLIDVTYRLTKVNENPQPYGHRVYQVYRLRFYSKETQAEFGLLYISFKDKRNNLVDGISLLSREKVEIRYACNKEPG